METAKLYENLFYLSLSFSGFLGTYFLAGIKSYLKNIKSEIQEVKTEIREVQLDQGENNKWKQLAEYRLRQAEMNLSDLPCMNKEECHHVKA